MYTFFYFLLYTINVQIKGVYKIMLRFKQFEALEYTFYVYFYADITNSVCFDLVEEHNQNSKYTLINGCSVVDYAEGLKDLIDWRINDFLLKRMIEDFKTLIYKLDLNDKVVIRKIDDDIQVNNRYFNVIDFNDDYTAFKTAIIDFIENIALNK